MRLFPRPRPQATPTVGHQGTPRPTGMTAPPHPFIPDSVHIRTAGGTVPHFFLPASPSPGGNGLPACLRFQHLVQTALPPRPHSPRTPLGRMLGPSRYSRLQLVPEDWRKTLRPAFKMRRVPKQHKARRSPLKARPPLAGSLTRLRPACVGRGSGHPLVRQMGGAVDAHA